MIPVEQWPGLEVGQAITTGNRSSLWRGTLRGRPVAIRASKRSEASLDWELELLQTLAHLDFIVPEPIPTQSGELRSGSWTVQRWIEGEPPTTESDWIFVAAELRRLHHSLDGFRQRPGACSITELRQVRHSIDANLDQTSSPIVERCLPYFDAYLEGHRCVIHGDPGPGNIRISPDSKVGLLDWDEARVDVPDLDLANLGIPVLSGQRRGAAEAAAHAWETLNGWIVEPDYAGSRFEELPTVHSYSGPELTDGTIIIRPRTSADATAQLEGEDHEITRWLTGGFSTLKRTRQHIDNVNRIWKVGGVRHNFGIYLASEGQPLVGNLDINLADIDLDLHEANLSYAVFPSWRRQGIAIRALELGLQYLRTLDGPPTPVLKIEPTNQSSLALAEHAGFVPTRSTNRQDKRLLIHHLLS